MSIIVWELGKIQAVFPENEIVKKFAEAMMEEAELYDGFLKSWDNPHEEFSEEKVAMGEMRVQCRTGRGTR